MERDHMVDLAIDGRVYGSGAQRDRMGQYGMSSFCLRQGQACCCCEHGNKHQGSVKCNEFLNYLGGYYCLKNHCAPWHYSDVLKSSNLITSSSPVLQPNSDIDQVSCAALLFHLVFQHLLARIFIYSVLYSPLIEGIPVFFVPSGHLITLLPHTCIACGPLLSQSLIASWSLVFIVQTH